VGALGLHSYLTYLRDRFLLIKELLRTDGSFFVQISQTNIHHVREVLDEVFEPGNFVSQVSYSTSGGFDTSTLSRAGDYVIWYAKDIAKMKYRPLFVEKESPVGDSSSKYDQVQLPDGTRRALTKEEKLGDEVLPHGSRIYQHDNIMSQGSSENTVRYWEFNGIKYDCGIGNHWKASAPKGMDKLGQAKRIAVTSKGKLRYVRFFEDFPLTRLTNLWTDVGGSVQSRSEPKLYAVQTGVGIVQRCMLMTTDPGDMVFDPTCGSGTTAYAGEQWGRRWITCDTSRVPLALARQRLLTATFPYYELKDHQTGPQGGFVYTRRQNRKGKEIGGLVPHITLGSIANDEQPAMEVLVDRPEVNDKVTRVAGPFVVEATIAPAQVVELNEDEASPPPQSLEDALSEVDTVNGGLPFHVAEPMTRYGDPATHIERMTQVLRQSKTLRLPGNRELVLADIRRMADSDVLHAEGLDAEGNRIAVVFGPEDGAISSNVVFEAAREAYFLKFPHLYFFGFAIQAKARELLEDRTKLRVPCTYVTVTPDVAMSDLLKTSRASEIFSVTGLPDAVIRKTDKKNEDGAELYEVELKGLDIFNPATMEQEDIAAHNLPMWMLDTDYDGMCFYATQVFFPKTAAWDNLQKSLKVEFDPSVWEHLAGTVSEPFPIGSKRRVAVKVIDERGNELMRVMEVAR